VSKDWLDVAFGSRSERFANDAAGMESLAALLRQEGINLVVLARDFAKSVGVLAKTDKVDVRVLRAFADVISHNEKRSRFYGWFSDPFEMRADSG